MFKRLLFFCTLFGCLQLHQNCLGADDNLNVLLVDWITDSGIANSSGDAFLFSPNDSRTISANFFLAAQHFNQRNTSMLKNLSRIAEECPDVKINVVTFCDEAGSPRLAGKIMNEYSASVDAVVGYASLASRVGAITGEALNELPTFSFWVADPVLSDRNNYRMFARNVVSDAHYLERLVLAVDALGYKKVALLVLTADQGPDFGFAALRLFQSKGITMLSVPYTFDSVDSYRSACKTIRDSRLNVVIVYAYASDITGFNGETQHLGIADIMEEQHLLGEDKVFIWTNADSLVGESDAQANANVSKMLHGSLQVLDGIDDSTEFENYKSNWPTFSPTTISFINSKVPPHNLASDYWEGCVNDKLNFQYPLDFFNDLTKDLLQIQHARAYDAVMSMGFAACYAVNSTGKTLAHLRSTDLNVTKTLYEAIGQLDFHGLTGRHRFLTEFDEDTQTDYGDRDPQSVRFFLRNFKVNPQLQTVESVDVATFDGNASQWIFDPNVVITYKASVKPPLDVTPPAVEMNQINESLKIFAFSLLGVLVLVNGFSVLFVYYYRRQRFIVQTQPDLVISILLCSTLAGFAIVPLAYDDSNSSSYNLSVACTLPLVFFFTGYETLLVLLFLRTMRVIAIFKRQSLYQAIMSKRQVKNVALLVFICCVLFSVAFVASDQSLIFERKITRVDNLNFPTSSIGICVAARNGSYGFLGVIVFLLFFSMLVNYVINFRLKDIPDIFNEAKYQGMLFSSTLNLWIVALPVFIVAFEQVQGRFIISVLFVFVSNFFIFSFVVAPKLKLLYYSKLLSYYSMNSDAAGGGSRHGSMLGRTPLHSTDNVALGGANSIASGASKQDNAIMDLEVGMKIEPIREKFRKFCDETFVTEHYNFLLEAMNWEEEFKNLGEAARAGKAGAIIEVYIVDGAMLQVNISEATKKQVLSLFAAYKQAGAHASANEFLDVILPAYKEVLSITKNGAWRDFVESGGVFKFVHTPASVVNVAGKGNNNNNNRKDERRIVSVSRKETDSTPTLNGVDSSRESAV